MQLSIICSSLYPDGYVFCESVRFVCNLCNRALFVTRRSWYNTHFELVMLLLKVVLGHLASFIECFLALRLSGVHCTSGYQSGRFFDTIVDIVY